MRGVQLRESFATSRTPPAVDGIFGPVTDSYVRGCRSGSGCVSRADHVALAGIVGPVTSHGFIAGIAVLD